MGETRVKTNLVLAACLLVSGATARAQQQPATITTPEAKPANDCAQLPEMQKQLDWDARRLKDWAELDRYRAANAALAPAVKEEARVVFMGDSITDMWQLPKSGGFFPGKPYVDRGIGGQTTPQMVLRFRADVIALQPKVVVILAGTNDIAGNTGPMTLEETEGNLATMAELARMHGIRVVLSSVMPVNDIADADGKVIVQTERRPPEKILALNEWIKKYAAENGHVYLDYFPATADEKGFLKSEITNDGLHPNAQGYAVMGPLAEKAIQEALKKKP
jgi:lysophospholipase L1-like esterase